MNIPGVTTPSFEPNVPSVNTASDSKSAFDDVLEAMFGENGGETKPGSETEGGEDKSFSPELGGGKSWEEIAKRFQSEKDKTTAELKKIQETINSRYQPLAEFYEQIFEDDEVKRAFIHELDPELIKQKDPHTFIKERLAKEFGDDYDPENSEDKLKARMYNVRIEQLLREALTEQGNKTPKALKELREERKKQKEAQNAEITRTKAEIQGDLKWDEQTYNSWLEWAQKIKPKDLAKLWDTAQKKSKKQSDFMSPFVSNVPGGNPPALNQFKQELDKWFGPNQ